MDTILLFPNPLRFEQAPVLAALTPSDAKIFASQLKDIVSACMANSRIALTGSGMVTLLNALRNVPVNGYAMWDAMLRVQLGSTPSIASALAMAEQLVARRVGAWPANVAAEVTPSVIVRWLSSSGPHPYTSARPALVAFLANLLCAVEGNGAQSALSVAQQKLIDKLHAEAAVDAAIALSQLSLSMRQYIACLVRGQLTGSMLAEHFRPGVYLRSFSELVLLLCEPQSAGGPLQLLPPYGALFNAMLSTDGAQLVSWRGGAWALDELVRDRLKFFFEHAAELRANHTAIVKKISKAVLHSFASDGIGSLKSGVYRPPESMDELERVPVFAAILSLLSRQEAMSKQNDGMSPLHTEYDSVLKAERAGQRDGKVRWYVSTAGFHIMSRLRILDAHVYFPKASLVEAGLTAGIVANAAAAAVKVWESHGMSVTMEGVPSMRKTSRW